MKCEEFYKGLLKCLLEDKNVLFTDLNNDNNLTLNYKELSKQIKADEIFCELVKLSMKKAYNNSIELNNTIINLSENRYGIKFMRTVSS